MRGRVDGLIIMAPQLSADELAQAIPAGLPAVLINSPADATHYNLRIDNRGGVMLMVRHLLAGGRRNIVHLAGYSGNLDAAERSAERRVGKESVSACRSRGSQDNEKKKRINKRKKSN